MKEKDIVCVCNSITYGEIVEAIEKKGLKTVEEVAKLRGKKVEDLM